MESLYVCHFSNGHIKVGRSIYAKSRIASHADRVACIGIELIEHHIVECVSHSAPAEAALISRCAEVATKRNKSEWFVGLNFLDVCDWADECASSTYDRPAININLDIAIKVEGGVANLAQKLGVSQNAISNWKLSDRGVPRAWEKLLELRYGRHRARIEKAERLASEDGA